MTIAHPTMSIMSKGAYEALIDQLRACQTTQEILEFEQLFNSKAESVQLHSVICELLRNRSISRVLAAKWLGTLIESRDIKILKVENNL